MNDKEKLEAIVDLHNFWMNKEVDGLSEDFSIFLKEIKKIIEADKGFICSKCGKESSSLRHGLCVICTKF